MTAGWFAWCIVRPTSRQYPNRVAPQALIFKGCPEAGDHAVFDLGLDVLDQGFQDGLPRTVAAGGDDVRDMGPDGRDASAVGRGEPQPGLDPEQTAPNGRCAGCPYSTLATTLSDRWPAAER
jgi:hypothetical protein